MFKLAKSGGAMHAVKSITEPRPGTGQAAPPVTSFDASAGVVLSNVARGAS